MNSPDTRTLTQLEIALRPGAIPWPNSLQDNIAELERPFQAPSRRKERDVNKVLTILDGLLTKGGKT